MDLNYIKDLVDSIEGWGFGEGVAESKQEVVKYYKTLIKRSRKELDKLELKLSQLVDKEWEI